MRKVFFLHELFGERTTVPAILLTFLFSIGMSVLLMGAAYPEWRQLEVWKFIILMLLIVDITGGVIANFSSSTNQYYKERRNAGRLFILIHIHPLLLAWL